MGRGEKDRLNVDELCDATATSCVNTEHESVVERWGRPFLSRKLAYGSPGVGHGGRLFSEETWRGWESWTSVVMGSGVEPDRPTEDGELSNISLSPRSTNAADQSGMSWWCVGRMPGSLGGSSPHLTGVLDSGIPSILQLNEKDQST